MAEGVLFNIAGGILNNLAASVCTEEARVLWGARNEHQRLADAVTTIRSVLLDAEEMAPKSCAVTIWLEEVTDALYKVDDLLDAALTDAQLQQLPINEEKKVKKVCKFFFMPNQLLYELKMGHHIKEIRMRLEAIWSDITQFMFLVRPFEGRVEERKRDDNYSLAGVKGVIGREKDREAVIVCLIVSNVEENVSIFRIVGVDGVGKTTLAQLILNDETIEKHFELKVWVCVSVNFDAKIIVKKFLESALKKRLDFHEMDTLTDRLQEQINKKRFLLVLDDVRDEDHKKFYILQQLLMNCVKGSKILVTTCKEKVAENLCQESYHLKGLGEQESWDLLKRMALVDGKEEEKSRIEGMGREILEVCAGVPLVLKTVGRLLYFKNTKTEWLNFIQNELPRLSCGDILSTLKLKYDMLPSHLKLCFTYCCLFPRDYEIDKLMLIKLWIAQGFVKSSQIKCLEDVGDDYFKTLLWDSLIEESKKDKFGRVTSYKMHELVHNVAIEAAGSLFATFDYKKRNIYWRTRHIAIGGHINNSVYEAHMLRTFLCPSVLYFKGKIDCEMMFSSLKHLRVLDLSNRKLKYLSRSICELKSLRYLDLSGNWKIKKLPNSLTMLINLQTLRISGCESLEELPRNIKRLFNLRHLENDGCKGLRYMPYELGELIMLQTLSLFVVDSSSPVRHYAGLNELIKLQNLRGKLCIYLRSYAKGVASKYKDALLREKPYLDSLHLEWSNGSDVNDSNNDMSLEGFQPHQNLKQLYLHNYPGPSLSSWLLSLTSLVALELFWCEKCKRLPSLSQLSSLKYLSISYMTALEYISDIGDKDEFSSSSSTLVAFSPSLESILLAYCPNLKGWGKSEHSFGEVGCGSSNSVEITMVTPITANCSLPSFPQLSKLEIEGCPLLTTMPMFPHLTKLCLDDARWTLLEPTMMMMMDTSTTIASSSSTPLSKLKEMNLVSTIELKILPEWLQNLTSLERLRIKNCHELKSLAPGLQHLTKLEHLHLSYCPELEIFNEKDEVQWQGFQSLRSLSLENLPKLKLIPLELQQIVKNSLSIKF